LFHIGTTGRHKLVGQEERQRTHIKHYKDTLLEQTQKDTTKTDETNNAVVKDKEVLVSEQQDFDDESDYGISEDELSDYE